MERNTDETGIVPVEAYDPFEKDPDDLEATDAEVIDAEVVESEPVEDDPVENTEREYGIGIELTLRLAH